MLKELLGIMYNKSPVKCVFCVAAGKEGENLLGLVFNTFSLK